MFTALAPQPNRATSTVTLSCGLVAIPLSVYTGTETTRVDRKEFFKGDTDIPVGRSPIRKDTGEVIEQADVVRMAQADAGSYVPLSDDEIVAATSPRGVADIEMFVPLKDIGAYSQENVAQVRPKAEKGIVNPAADRAFAVLLTAMAKRKVAAVVKVAMRGPARYALLTPEADLLLIRNCEQVREARPAPEHKPSKAEVDMAVSLIETIGIETPTLTDDSAAAVRTYVNAKAEGATPAQVNEPTPTADILDAMQASIIAAKKNKKAA